MAALAPVCFFGYNPFISCWSHGWFGKAPSFSLLLNPSDDQCKKKIENPPVCLFAFELLTPSFSTEVDMSKYTTYGSIFTCLASSFLLLSFLFLHSWSTCYYTMLHYTLYYTCVVLHPPCSSPHLLFLLARVERAEVGL